MCSLLISSLIQFIQLLFKYLYAHVHKAINVPAIFDQFLFNVHIFASNSISTRYFSRTNCRTNHFHPAYVIRYVKEERKKNRVETRGASTSAYALIDTQPHAYCPHADYVWSAITSLLRGALSLLKQTVCDSHFGSLYREGKKERDEKRGPCANETGFLGRAPITKKSAHARSLRPSRLQGSSWFLFETIFHRLCIGNSPRFSRFLYSTLRRERDARFRFTLSRCILYKCRIVMQKENCRVPASFCYISTLSISFFLQLLTKIAPFFISI